MADDRDDTDELEERIDRLEETLEALRDELDGHDEESSPRIPDRAAERALRLTERVAVPATVAALEANVRVLTYVQERLREFERRDNREPSAMRSPVSRVSERVLDRLDESLYRLEDVIEDSDLPQNTEARQLLERARELNEEVRGRVAEPDRTGGGPTVVEIDVEEELDEIRDDVETERTDESDDADES